MEKFKIISIVLASTIAVILFGLAMLWKSYPKDCYLEQKIEEVIEHETGLKLDLSPEENPSS